MSSFSSYRKAFGSFASELRIISKEGNPTNDPRGTPLILRDSQRRFMEEIGKGIDEGVHIFNCLKNRQCGITTISLALIDVFWLAVHNSTIGCLVTDTESNKNVNRKLIEHYVASFPEGYFGDAFSIITSNRDMMQFSNGSRLDFKVAGVRKKGLAWAEGVGYSVIHATEIGKYADAEGFKSLLEGFAQTNPARLLVCESTANGFNHWRERWMAGLKNIFTERSFFIGWWADNTNVIPRSDPRYGQYAYAPAREELELIRTVAAQYQHAVTKEQLAWIRWREDSAGQEQDLLLQNQPWTAQQAFISSGYSFFPLRVVTMGLKRIHDGKYRYKGYRYDYGDDFFSFRMEELASDEENRELIELKVWEEPVEGGKYVIGFDPSYGRNDNKDRHAISVWRCYADRLVQCAEYATADVLTKHASWVCFHLAAAYGDTMTNVELNGPGRLVMEEFDHLRQLLNLEMNEPKVKAKNWQEAGAQVRWYIYRKVDSPGAGYLANTDSNYRVKAELMHSLRGAYATHEIDISSIRLLREMELVIVNDGSIGAPESSNPDLKDDRVFAMAYANKAWQDWVRKQMLSEGQTFEVVSARENGDVPPMARNINSLVARFLARADEEVEEPRGSKFHVDNGLV